MLREKRLVVVAESTKHGGERVFSCPNRGSSGACEPPAAAAALPERVANHGVQQTVGMLSLLAAAADDRLLWVLLLLLRAARQPKSPASQKNEPEMPLACP